MSITIEPLRDADRRGWERLYRGYRDFYGHSHDPEVLDNVWGWLMGPEDALECRVARRENGEIVGFMHFRNVPRPMEGGLGGYLDDLFVDESARGTGTADKMIDALTDIGKHRRWTNVRWLTGETNQRARGFYDRISVKTPYLTYQIKL